jgi:hypothetical protein
MSRKGCRCIGSVSDDDIEGAEEAVDVWDPCIAGMQESME